MNAVNIIQFPVSDTNQQFELFWQKYPKRIARLAAIRAFEVAITKTTIDEILKGLDSYVKHKPDYQDWCHAATWLNAERWTDSWDDVKPLATSVNQVTLSKEYDRILERMDTIKRNYSGFQSWTVEDVKEFKVLKVRRDVLRQTLGVVV